MRKRAPYTQDAGDKLEWLHRNRSVENEQGCWLFTGRLHKSGWAMISIARPDGGHDTVTLHRLAWAHHHHRPVPPRTTLILHTCGNKHCFNPEHLALAAETDAGRRRLSYKTRAHPLHKLTEESVQELRSLYASGDFTLRELAARYGVAAETARKAVRGITWAFPSATE